MKCGGSCGFVLAVGAKAHITAVGLRRPRHTASLPEVQARAFSCGGLRPTLTALLIQTEMTDRVHR